MQTERIPVYERLNDRLRTALGDDYRCGDKFLTEREISHQFSVSRATANKALASLVSEGLLEFRRGIGTFVRRDAIHYDVRSLVSFTEKARAAGKVPSTQLISFDRVDAGQTDAMVCEALGASPESKLWHMQRLRLADGCPVILERRYINQSRCPKLTKAQAAGSLYHALTEKHSLAIAGADEIIRAVLLTASDAKQLGVPANSPALEVVAVGFIDDRDSSPLWWERTLYRGDQYEFHSRLGPIRTATPAQGRLRQTK
ncbi:HTH-type transcriptional repressor DasR [Rubripirellula lacrimiformis]|uniref:HTH-type transcriptional repressor DasR n=1 Tax=Rubripirellula lacrimiformis TaxID=1930273 RepID=A0A517NKS4_9BACT|nr:GntR family transcriptional regulator [Rubripirellula lacrimiformis]QDT07744.1 HTH-type transcriptional repressor DasR [Rubripirellula lacrimiformis]